MCDPTTAALMVASTAMSLYGQKQQADQQTEYQNNLQMQRDQQIAVNTDLANKAAAAKQADINTQVVQKEAAAGDEFAQNAIGAAEARATATVASGEAGVAGISVDALINDFSRKEGRYADSVGTNLEGFRYNAEQNKKQTEAERVGRIGSIQPYIPSPVSGPDYFGAIAGLGMSAASMWNQKNQIERASLLKTHPISLAPRTP